MSPQFIYERDFFYILLFSGKYVSSLFYIMQIIHIAENSTKNNVLLAIATFKYRIYCNMLSFTIPCSGSYNAFFICAAPAGTMKIMMVR